MNNPGYRFAGVWSFVVYLWRSRRGGGTQDQENGPTDGRGIEA